MSSCHRLQSTCEDMGHSRFELIQDGLSITQYWSDQCKTCYLNSLSVGSISELLSTDMVRPANSKCCSIYEDQGTKLPRSQCARVDRPPRLKAVTDFHLQGPCHQHHKTTSFPTSHRDFLTTSIQMFGFSFQANSNTCHSTP